ncbi:hypothetical protein HPB47_009242, partial [Ixodes persulcatus]
MEVEETESDETRPHTENKEHYLDRSVVGISGKDAPPIYWLRSIYLHLHLYLHHYQLHSVQTATVNKVWKVERICYQSSNKESVLFNCRISRTWLACSVAYPPIDPKKVHLETCEYFVIECGFKEYGCNEKAPRKEMQEHEKDPHNALLSQKILLLHADGAPCKQPRLRRKAHTVGFWHQLARTPAKGTKCDGKGRREAPWPSLHYQRHDPTRSEP